jgi:hypothetical protein
MVVLLARRVASDGACDRPRNVYIDLGVNWCNTARLYESIEPHASEPHEVFGFEASPLIQPFAEQYFRWLELERQDEPLSCLPRSGSTEDLNL